MGIKLRDKNTINEGETPEIQRFFKNENNLQQKDIEMR